MRKQYSIIFYIICIILTGCNSQEHQPLRGHFPLPKDVQITRGEPGRYGGVFVLTESQEPKTFNFLVVTDVYSSLAVSQIFSSLVEYNPIDERFEPSLALSWEIAQNKKTYTFRLREGVRWSDGIPFTADDVIFTFDAIFDERYPNRYQDQFTVAGKPITYKKIDDHTVAFTTQEVYAPFINDIGSVIILPKHILYNAYSNGTLQKTFTTQTAINTPEAIVGTGPFKIQSYRPGERIVYEPNPHFWKVDTLGQRLPYINYLIFKFVADTNTQTALFATGQSDAAGISPKDYAWVKKGEATYNFTLYERGPDSGTYFIWFNQHRGVDKQGKPYLDPIKLSWFTNKAFRQAISYGIDRKGIIEAIYFGLGEPLTSIISPANRKWHNPNTHEYPYNPEKAKTLLLDAGFYYDDHGKLRDARGNRVSFELIASEGSQNLTTLAVTFTQNMKDLGIDVTLKYVDFGTLLNKTSGTFDYDASMMGFSGSIDPSGGKAIYLSDGDMHLWYPDQKTPATPWEARIDQLVRAQEQELDETKRIALVHEMQMIFSDELPLIFLFNPVEFSGIKNKWHNVQVPPTGSIIWNLEELWTDPTQ